MRTSKVTSIQDYYAALERTFDLAAETLTAALPHKGERGRNDEERLRSFLSKVLPRRFGVGTGFLVCPDATVPPSAQSDVIVYDDWNNSPLYREFASFVFPVEMVFASIEVKGSLRTSQLKKSVDDIQRIRKLAKHGWQVMHGSTAVPNQPGKFFGATIDVPLGVPPRTYMFAYDSPDWTTPQGFARAWARALKAGGHLHGAVLLSRGWFLYQAAYTEGRVKLKMFTDHALLRFTNKLILDISGTQVLQTSLPRYFRLDEKPRLEIDLPIKAAK